MDIVEGTIHPSLYPTVTSKSIVAYRGLPFTHLNPQVVTQLTKTSRELCQMHTVNPQPIMKVASKDNNEKYTKNACIPHCIQICTASFL